MSLRSGATKTLEGREVPALLIVDACETDQNKKTWHAFKQPL